MRHQVPGLLGREGRVHASADRAHAQGSEMEYHPLGAIVAHDGHMITRLHAQANERFSSPADLLDTGSPVGLLPLAPPVDIICRLIRPQIRLVQQTSGNRVCSQNRRPRWPYLLYVSSIRRASSGHGASCWRPGCCSGRWTDSSWWRASGPRPGPCSAARAS